MVQRVGLVVVVALAVCEHAHAAPGGGNELVPSRAAALGEFRDNPLLEAIPADTAYAFASFKAIPLDVIHKFAAAFGPIQRRTYQELKARSGEPDGKDVFLNEIAALDARTLERAGFSVGARFAFYGLGGYPVFRLELTNGDRVFELIQGTARRMNKPIPPPGVRGGRRYWITDARDGVEFAAIAPKELVIAFAPRSTITDNLAVLLGEQRPPKRITTAQFRELARRDGFTGQGVGFIDFTRIPDLAVDAVATVPACRAAFKALIQHTPRLAVGFDDFTTHRFSFGVVLELAPDALAAMRSLSTTLAGYERMIHANPPMGVAVALNLEQGRAVLLRVGAAIKEFGEHCKSPGLASGGTEIADAAGRPLPPFLAGLRGGIAALISFKVGPALDLVPGSLEGFAAVHLDRTAPLLQLASQQTALELQPDGKARALPVTVPFAGHIAASETTIAAAAGRGSAVAAGQLVKAPAVPAPLVLVQVDYQRAAQLLPNQQDESVRAIAAAFGMARMQLVADERGLVAWASFALR